MGGGIADRLIVLHLAICVADAAAAQEVQWCESVRMDAFRNDLRSGHHELCGAKHMLVPSFPWRSIRSCSEAADNRRDVGADGPDQTEAVGERPATGPSGYQRPQVFSCLS